MVLHRHVFLALFLICQVNQATEFLSSNWQNVFQAHHKNCILLKFLLFVNISSQYLTKTHGHHSPYNQHKLSPFC